MMSNDTVFTEENKNLLRQLGLFNVQLEKTGEPEIFYKIEWGQAKYDLFSNKKEDYLECVYTIKGAPKTSKVKVFFATTCGSPPKVINTSGHQQKDGTLHFGYIYHDDKKDVKAIFFVIHPMAWGPYQKRFRTNTMLALVDSAINSIGEKAGGKLGAIIGAKVGTLIPIPIVGTVAGAVAGYFIGEATTSIVDCMAGDYLRHIG
ncbi:MAG: hypothetical protein GY757_62435 [bacterium]|nr:hypothetical protein [bacterium]